MNIIKVKGIKSFGYHGCLKEEAKIGGEFETDLTIYTNFKQAAKNDDLTQTVDYVLVNKIVEKQMAKRSKLIETVGYRILKKIKKISKDITKVKVEIKKINPPINGNVNFVSIVVEE